MPRAMLLGLAVTALVLASPSATQASRIDNDSDRPLSFWFSCGLTCGNYFDDVPSGGSVGRPGVDGAIEAGVFTKDLNWICMSSSHQTIDRNERIITAGPHGEVGIRYDAAKKTFTAVSKGGNKTVDIVGEPIWPIIRSSRTAAHRCWYGTP